MSDLRSLTTSGLNSMQEALEHELDLQRANKLSLDLSRGKPSPEQSELSVELDAPLTGYIAEDGTDTRNYGAPRGIPEARAIGGELLEVAPDRVFAFGSSSLSLMYQVASIAMQRGLWNDGRRWSNNANARVLAPVPGYDRHFTICESLGIGMVNVPMTDAGPDMAEATALAAKDPSIKGIWCVPKYSNPTGCIYTEETVRAIANLPAQAAADDFLIFWDNAYAKHDFEFPATPLANLYQLACAQGTEEHVALFASTSKMTYASGGISFCGGADTLLNALQKALSVMCIGPDKVNQLRHARFLSGRIEPHMARHAAVLQPKFAVVDRVFREDLGDLGIAHWNQPKGGYFVSLYVLPGTARRVVELAAGAGLTLTPAGAAFPYGKDPKDEHIRVAPSFATLDEIEVATRLLTRCVQLAAIAKMKADH